MFQTIVIAIVIATITTVLLASFFKGTGRATDPVYVLNCKIEPSEGLYRAHSNYQMKIYFGINPLASLSSSLPDRIEFEYMYVDMNGQIFLEEATSCYSKNFKADGKNFFVTVPLTVKPSLRAASFGQAWPYSVLQRNGTYWSNSHYLEDEKKCREKIESFLKGI